MTGTNTYPKLHNAMWPGIVGKGAPGAEPTVPLQTLLDLTANAEADGQRFEGVDLFLAAPHVDIDSTEDDIKRLADRIGALGLAIGSLVAPIWVDTGGGSAMGSADERQRFLTQVRKACVIGRTLRELGIRPSGGIRFDSSAGVEDWDQDPDAGTKLIAQTFDQAADIAQDHGEFLVAEGEICWGGMHSWREMVRLLEMVGRPEVVAFQADMAHVMLYTLGYNREQDRLLPSGFDWSDKAALDAAYKKVADALRPWTRDFHVAQNDGTVSGSGHHAKTGRHCQVGDPNGRLDIVKHAGYWLRDENGELTKSTRHICWDGCIFPNEVMESQETWNAVLGAMVKVRDAHGWQE